MKKRRGLTINIHLTNRWLYTFIAVGILAIIGVGVYAATYSASGAGHPYTELSTCSANQFLKMNSAGNAWTCADMPAAVVETDPTVKIWAKDDTQNISTYGNVRIMRTYRYDYVSGMVSGHSNPRCPFDTSDTTINGATTTPYYFNTDFGSTCYDWISSNYQYRFSKVTGGPWIVTTLQYPY